MAFLDAVLRNENLDPGTLVFMAPFWLRLDFDLKGDAALFQQRHQATCVIVIKLSEGGLARDGWVGLHKVERFRVRLPICVAGLREA